MAPKQKMPEDEALQAARRSAHELLLDLDRAEQVTSGWKNRPLALALVSNAVERSLSLLDETRWRGRESQLISNEFWRVARDPLECGKLQRRAREKPLGYAGDFEMLRMFYEHDLCDHPLGSLFDEYFQGQAAVEAVRARIDLVAAEIVNQVSNRPTNRRFRIASIGCGPAIDLELALRWLPEQFRKNIRIELFDLDQAALAHAAERLNGLVHPEQVSIHRENLYRLAESAEGNCRVSSADFIVCTGLFDYLPDRPAAALLKFLRDRLVAEGTLMVGNFAPHNPSRAYMEWVGNWYLIYRTEDELRRLAINAGLSDEHLRLRGERTGIDLFLVVKRSA